MQTLLLGGLLAGFLLVATVLLLSDRAGGMGGRVKAFIIGVGETFERAFGVDWLDRDSIPGTFDQIGHAALWGTGMLVLGLAFRRWIHPLATAVAITAISISFEFLQATATTSRKLDPGDAVANTVGVLIALVVVLLVGVLIDFIVRPLREWLAARS